jgi:hypothetical protein
LDCFGVIVHNATGCVVLLSASEGAYGEEEGGSVGEVEGEEGGFSEGIRGEMRGKSGEVLVCEEAYPFVIRNR